MAHTAQSRKRARQNVVINERNRAARSEFRTQVKAFIRLVRDGKLEEAGKQLCVAESRLDKAAKRNIIHTGKADRAKARLKLRYAKAVAASSGK